jgi:Flp pilus assembly protein TadD
MSSSQDDMQSSGFEWEDNLEKEETGPVAQSKEIEARKHNARAKQLFAQGHLAEAEAALTEALKYAPDWAALYDNLGTICAEQNKFAEALLNYSLALRLDPTSPTILYNIGYFLLQNGLDASQHFLEKTLQTDAAYPDARRALSDVFIERGETTKAITMLVKAIEQNPQDKEARFRLSDIFWNQGDFHEARQQLHGVLRLAPDDQRAWHNLGLVAIMLEDEAEAEKALRQALTLDPRYMLAHYHIACFYANGFRLDEALYHLELAAELDGKTVCEWAEDDNKLDHLRSHPRFNQILSRVL